MFYREKLRFLVRGGFSLHGIYNSQLPSQLQYFEDYKIFRIQFSNHRCSFEITEQVHKCQISYTKITCDGFQFPGNHLKWSMQLCSAEYPCQVATFSLQILEIKESLFCMHMNFQTNCITKACNIIICMTLLDFRNLLKHDIAIAMPQGTCSYLQLTSSLSMTNDACTCPTTFKLQYSY